MEAVVFSNSTDGVFLILSPAESVVPVAITSLTLCVWFLVSSSSEEQRSMTQPLVHFYSENGANLLDLTYVHGVVSFTVAGDDGMATLGVVS